MSIRSRKWEDRETQVGKLVGMTFGILVLLSAIAVTQTQEQSPPQATPPQAEQQQAAPQGAPSQAAPPVAPSQAAPSEQAPQGPAATAQTSSESESHGAAPLRVMVGKSLLINTTERLKRVSVTDPGVADAIVITPTQILVHGRAAGEVSLLIWDELERSRSFDLRVDVDVSAASEEEKRIFPDEQITVTPSRSAIVLSGHVTTEDIAARAGKIAEAYSKNVVNVLTFGPVGAQEVLLEVKFAEVDRSAALQLGINYFLPNSGHTTGTLTTGQYGGSTIFYDHPNQWKCNYDLHRTHTSHDQPDQPFEPFPIPQRYQLWGRGAGVAAEEPVADPCGTEPDRGERQGSQLPGWGRVSFSHRPTGTRLHRSQHLLQGVWRQVEVHPGDHAEREHSPASGARGESIGFHQWTYDFRLQHPGPEHTSGGHRI
jgi:hypothetical protein